MSLNKQMIAELHNRWWGTRSISSLLMLPSHELQMLNKVTWERRHLLTRPLYTGSNSTPAFYSKRSRISGWSWVEGEKKKWLFWLSSSCFAFCPTSFSWNFLEFSGATLSAPQKCAAIEKGATSCTFYSFQMVNLVGRGISFWFCNKIHFLI